MPKRAVSNHELIKLFGIDTSDEWIVQRTGIEKRHLADADETTATLGVGASRQALDQANLLPEEVDAVIVATSTAEFAFPSTANVIQAQLGITGGIGFDVQAACNGFLFGLHLADLHVRNGNAKTVLLIGVDVMSRLIDWGDRNTCILFGDAAGALVVQSQSAREVQKEIVSIHLQSVGEHTDFLYSERNGTIKMLGKEVFRHAVTRMTSISEIALKHNTLKPEQVDWFIPHQANLRIIQAVAAHLKIAPERAIVTIKDHGNTSAASIPLALIQGIEDERLQPGNVLLLSGLGAGFSWGASVVRW